MIKITLATIIFLLNMPSKSNQHVGLIEKSVALLYSYKNPAHMSLKLKNVVSKHVKSYQLDEKKNWHRFTKTAAGHQD